MPVVTDRTIALIRTPEEITTHWLTAVLQAEGSLPSHAAVSSLTSTRIGEGVGVLSRIFRVAPTYDSATDSATESDSGLSAPNTVIVKLATEDLVPRFTADLLSAFAREVNFYAKWADSTKLRTARCFAAVQATDNSDFTLVLEDLSAARFQDQLQGCTWPDALASIEALAGFHAPWMDDQTITAPAVGRPQADLYLPLLNDSYLGMLPMLFQQNWDAAKSLFSEQLHPQVVAFGDRWGEHCEFMLTELMSPYTTMCHGDWRADNVMFVDGATRDGSAGGEVVLGIDFQLMGTGSGTYDVAYFVSQSIDPEVRVGRDRELVLHYVQALGRHGIAADADKVWRQYQVGLLFDLSYPVNSALAFETLPERGQQLLRSMITRASSAIVDTNAIEVLPG
jgi:aminoglycoside/choline kinase family phosphotransferase